MSHELDYILCNAKVEFLARLYGCTGRAIALPPASAAALTLAKCSNFTLNFFMRLARGCQASYPVLGQVFCSFYFIFMTFYFNKLYSSINELLISPFAVRFKTTWYIK